MTVSQFIYQLLLRNELEAMRGKPLTRPQLQHNLEQEFRHKQFDYMRNHTLTFGTLHNRYNQGKLYASQPQPILVSFRYDNDGFIVESKNANTYLSFDTCREICASFQVADPRFFTFKELTEVRKRASLGEEPWTRWSIPSHEEVQAIEKRVGKSAYLSIRFPTGLGLQETVADM